MHAVKILWRSVFLLLILVTPATSMATEVGGGYSRQLLGNIGLEQYEIFVREPLAYKTSLSDGLQLSSAVEFAMAIIREDDVAHSEVGRFFLMPQLVLKPNDRMHFFAGLGAGFMGGDGEFTKHNLGGSFFLASKLGMRIFFSKDWGLEYGYYHQSNGGMYDYNASLNMLQLAIFLNY
jgi:hypothetical protein